ncbi:MAG: hypothetical protein KC933_24495 [Myxococcales bacterium]|nr:hypothetical protein [Myxococcales bacterium]
MPRCTHCGHDFAVSEGFKCPACAKDWRGPAEASGRPAHLALLEGAAPAPTPKPRIVSTAGPSVPVLKRQDDSVPSGWMARLEAAKAVAQSASGPANVASEPPPTPSAPPPTPSAPPPLKPALAKKGKGLETVPAHLLVARLEADEKKRSDAQPNLFAEPTSQDLISHVKVDLPKAPKKKKVPDWVVMLLLGVLVVGGVGAVYSAVKKEPPPKAVVDPALKAAAERRKQAMAALEEGHTFALEGRKGADQAIAAYSKALELEPTLAPAERGIAIAYAAKDDDATAVKHYRRYLELSPDAKDADEVKKIIRRWEEAEARKKGK